MPTFSLKPCALGALIFLSPFGAHAAASLSRGPYLQDLSSRGAAVMLELSEASPVVVEVQRGSNVESKKLVKSGSDMVHEVVIPSLEPATTYAYRVLRGEDENGQELSKGTFTTAPEDDRPFSFIVYGDNRSDAAAHTAIVRQMMNVPSVMLIQTGDMVYNGANSKDWYTFFQIEHDLLRTRCVFPAIGNHELSYNNPDGIARYTRLFRLPSPSGANERYYTFRWGMARFLMVDAQDDFQGAQRDWIESTLEASAQEKGIVYRFVVMHHGPFSSGPHGGNQPFRKAKLTETLRKHKVDAIFAGHDHAYERGAAEGIRYIVSGGGGAPLYKRERNHKATIVYEAVHHFLKVHLETGTAKIQVIRLDGTSLETCSFPPGGGEAWDCDGHPNSKNKPDGPSVSSPTNPVAGTGKKCDCSFQRSHDEPMFIASSFALLFVVYQRRKQRKLHK